MKRDYGVQVTCPECKRTLTAVNGGKVLPHTHPKTGRPCHITLVRPK